MDWAREREGRISEGLVVLSLGFDRELMAINSHSAFGFEPGEGRGLDHKQNPHSLVSIRIQTKRSH